MQAARLQASVCPLADLGVIAMRGRDAVPFLQGQISSDVTKLAVGGALLAGLHNPQGRTIALLRLARPNDESILAVLPAPLVEPVAARLRKYVLRAKVVITDESANYRVIGLPRGTPLPEASAVLPISSTREWAIVPATADSPLASMLAAAATSREAWRALDVAEGIPQVYLATSEAFVAQMLNLDVLGGIAFDKGCYTGQEVIARAHYRGRVKRRVQRFRTRDGAALAPGASGHFVDGRSFRVVESAALPDGSVEFLAVTAFGDARGPEASADAGADGGETSVTTAARIVAESLPLPYAWPD